MKNLWRTILVCTIISLLVTTLIVFVVFAIRTIIDPMYRNPNVIQSTKRIFYVFLMPYYELEAKFIGLNPDSSHRVHLLWTPIGMLATALYIALGGNLICAIFRGLRSLGRKKED